MSNFKILRDLQSKPEKSIKAEKGAQQWTPTDVKGGVNYVIIKTQELYESDARHLDDTGLKFALDPSFNPERHCRIYGEVVQIPVRLSKKVLGFEGHGFPGYHDPPEDIIQPAARRINEIKQDVKVGDTIYFHYTVMEPNSVHRNVIQMIDTGERDNQDRKIWDYYIRVSYEQIFCIVRYFDDPYDWATATNRDSSLFDAEFKIGGKPLKIRRTKKYARGYIDGKHVPFKQLIPVGGWVMVKPDMETWEEILVPVPATGADGKVLKDKNGDKIMKPKDKWIQTKVQPQAKYLLGFVKFVGPPLSRDKCEIKAGDHVYYQRDADWRVRIEGQIFYCMQQRHIMGIKLPTDTPSSSSPSSAPKIVQQP